MVDFAIIKFQPGPKIREALFPWFLDAILQAILIFMWKSNMYCPCI